MNLIFISTTEFPKPVFQNAYQVRSHLGTQGKSLSEICEFLSNAKQEDNLIFIIDVHCSFKDIELSVKQGGVIIYRHLLSLFQGNESNLKVIFYSPLQLSEAVAMSSAENYILNLLPFIECNYDGSFQIQLVNEIEKGRITGYSQFNNASENLLSGWAVNGKKKLQIRDDRKILFVDDENKQWEITLDLLLGPNNFTIFNSGAKDNFQKIIQPLLSDTLASKEDILKIDIGNQLSNSLKDHYLVFNDFYLHEMHVTDAWMSEEQLRSKSGFKFFKIVKILDPAVPFVFHTSSNKISYYKYFDQLGVDDWHVKDSRIDVPISEKKSNYEYFSKTISSFYEQPRLTLYERLRETLKRILFIEKEAILWWKETGHIHKDKFTKAIYPDLIFQQLYESWFAIRQFVNKEISFEDIITSDIKRGADYFIPVSVIANLYKIKEDFQDKLDSRNFTVDIGNNWLDNALEIIRNTASHIRHKNAFHVIDAVIYFELVLKYLEKLSFRERDKNLLDFRFLIKNDLDSKYKNQEFNYSSVLCYLTIHKQQLLKQFSFDTPFKNLFVNNLNIKIKALNKVNKTGIAQSDNLYNDLEKYRADMMIILKLIDSLMACCSSPVTNYNELDSCLNAMRSIYKIVRDSIGRNKIIPFEIYFYKQNQAIGHSKEIRFPNGPKKDFITIKEEFETNCEFIFIRQRTLLQANISLMNALLDCFRVEDGVQKITPVN